MFVLYSEDSMLQGIVFSGAALRVASVVLGRKVRNDRDVERELQRLKDASVVAETSNTIAFMFSCCGRGQHHYRRKRNVESAVFRRLFPNIPLVGFFGNGEIGHEFLPHLRAGASNTEEESDLPEVLHSYTSIFVVLSWQK